MEQQTALLKLQLVVRLHKTPLLQLAILCPIRFRHLRYPSARLMGITTTESQNLSTPRSFRQAACQRAAMPILSRRLEEQISRRLRSLHQVVSSVGLDHMIMVLLRTHIPLIQVVFQTMDLD